MQFFKTLVSFVFFLLFGSLTAQNCNCDAYSLNRKEMDSLIDIADYEKVHFYLAKLDKENSEACKATANGYKAEILSKLGFIDSAQKVLDKASLYYGSSACPEKDRYKFYAQTAEVSFLKNNYEEALNYSLKMFEIASSEKDNLMLSECNLRVSNIFVKMSQPEKARQYAVLARNCIEQLPESYKKYHLYNILANRYNNMYQDFKEKKYLDTIEFFMDGIRAHAIKLGPYNRLLEQYFRKKAFLALKLKDFDKSLKYLDSAKAIVKVFPIRNELYSINGDKANIYRKQKQFALAEQYADSCLFYAQKENIVSSLINAYDIVYMVARDAGKPDKALLAFESMTRINDSIIGVKNTGKIAELEQKYNKAQNEKTIRELNQESEIKNLRIRLLIIAIALAVLILIAIVFFYRQSLIRNKQKIMEAEQRLNRSRINPHFFFNAITTLQGIAVRENDGKKIASGLFKFSSLMRQTLESSYNDYVSIDTELEFINKYIELQQLKEENKFSFEIKMDDSVESSDVLIPAMIIQPFLENSIEHGFKGVDYEGKIIMSIEISDTTLEVELTDNGVGLNSKESSDNKHISRAMQITKDRLFLINKEKGTKASYSVVANSPSGVKVKISLPLLYK